MILRLFVSIRSTGAEVAKSISTTISGTGSDTALATTSAVANYVSGIAGDLSDRIDTEAQTRADADTALGGRIDTEERIRAAVDEALDVRVTALEAGAGGHGEEIKELKRQVKVQEKDEQGHIRTKGTYVDGKLKTTMAQNVENLDDALYKTREAFGGSFDDDGKWTADIEASTEAGAVSYGNFTVNKVKSALDQIVINIGDGDVLGNDGKNGVVKSNTINQNIATVESHFTAVDASIGDRSKMNNTTFDSYASIAGKDIASAVTSVTSSVGTASDLGDAFNGVSSSNTVNKNIYQLNAAIGDISGLQSTVYSSETTNVTDAIRALDSNIYRLDN